LVVVAAGNNSAPQPNYPALHSRELDNVISVGAHDSANQWASFANRVGSSGAVQVDAPGVNINSTVVGGGYGEWYGTSMATPHVAGAAALILSANPRLSAAQLRMVLVQMATRTIRNSDGRGGLNVAASLPLAVNAYTPSAMAAGWETNVLLPVREDILVHVAAAEPAPWPPSSPPVERPVDWAAPQPVDLDPSGDADDMSLALVKVLDDVIDEWDA
jgi:subtilisin family serine protease